MSFVSPALDHVAKKIARVSGVEVSCIAKDGAIDAIIEGGYNRDLRSRLLEMGRRAMVPVRVYYRMGDGRAIGESEALEQYGEAVEDYYTAIKVAGFAGEPQKAPPDEVAGDAYGKVDVKKDVDARDSSGQLKLKRIRSKTRGRPVVGWRYGDQAVRNGCRVKFKKPTSLQWTMSRSLSVQPGATGLVTGVSSRSPTAFISIGGYDRAELPVHAIGHIYDVMVSPALESREPSAPESKGPLAESPLMPSMKKLIMTVGFGRQPGTDDTPTNSAHFKGPTQPDLIGYAGIEDSDEDPEEDMLVPDEGEKGGVGDGWAAQAQRDPRVMLKLGREKSKKKVLLGKRK